MKKTLSLIAIVFLVGLLSKFGLSLLDASSVFAAERIFTVEELSEFDGKDDRKSYTSYQGIVYDVSDSLLWKLGEHFGLDAGVDLTDRMEEAPHGDEVFTGFEVVGMLEGFESTQMDLEDPTVSKESVSAMNSAGGEEKSSSPWYARRIKIGGFSVLGWTGILLGIFFVLTFGTCFALPWAKLPLPWKGKKIGEDPLDAAGKHMPWSSVHKHFVWITVVVGIIHGIIGFLQMIGIYL